MTRKEALAELIAKVEAGTIPASDFDAFVPVFNVTTTGNDAHMAYRGSLDAALALHQAVLPGWALERLTMWPSFNGECGASLWGTHEEKDGGRWHSFVDGRTEAKADNPARAWLLAILKALHEMETEQ